eukprot:TRINITY_DN9987_c0_g5_i1.p1 TRINITY_DN9987_c0_g5~~TRINITY_DN9987_c0_g5_i1.p1  ORF type:complete len:267 (+),score=52.12 TRINITY_DN9987_c0_g5_i1:58-858(+)
MGAPAQRERSTRVLRNLEDNEYVADSKLFELFDGCYVEICEELRASRDDESDFENSDASTLADCAYSCYSNTLWDGALSLSALIRKEPWRVRGMRVLEIGAGLGLPSIVAAALGGRVVATEQLPLSLLTREVRRNHRVIERAGGIAEVKELDWSQPAEEIHQHLGTFDLVLGCDILAGVKAGTDHFNQILKVVEATTSVWGECLLTWVPRMDVSYDRLLKAVRSALHGWEADFLDSSTLDEAFLSQGAGILHLRRIGVQTGLEELD